MQRRRAWLLLAALALFAPDALAARVELPLRVPLQTVRQALATQLAASAAAPTEIFRDGPCRHLALESPQLAGQDGELRLTGPGKAAIGVELAGKCQNAAEWTGNVELRLVPRLDEAGRLRVRVVDSKLDDAGEGKASPAGLVWQLAKPQVHQRLEAFSYDLGASRAALAGMLRSAAPSGEAAAMAQVLDTLTVLPPRVEPTHVVVPLALELPDAWLRSPAPAASAAPLTDAELEALEQALAPWDAFLVYSVRQVALESDDGALRKRLFTLLLDSRYQLVALLAGDVPRGADPLRALLIDAWNELRALLADAQRDGLLGKSVLRYALFVEAGDALVALEQAAPGLRLSAESLRQLARSLRPGEAGDPLAYGWDVDEELRGMFGVGAIVEPAPRSPAPPQAPVPPPGRSSLPFFLRAALAAEGAGEAKQLDRWVPTREELDEYEPLVAELLEKTAALELGRAGLRAPYDATFRSLVPTTALIESCWHQYVARGGKATYLRSAAGSVGMLQVNQHVWRGFYDVNRLRWDTAYNALAGAQILMRYVKDYAIPYAEKKGDPTVVPRAAYAVYNAGPRAVGRFDKPKPHPREARVDGKLWSLYRGLAAGGQADLKSCGVRAPG